MNKIVKHEGRFIGYEYKNVTISREMSDLYADCFPNFGWILDGTKPSLTPNTVTMKFKRDRKIINKTELTRLQREFESHMSEINRLESSKTFFASIVAYSIGIFGTAFMAGSTFAIVADKVLLCIILAVPAFIGWISPYFCYRHISMKKTQEVTALIDEKYDAVYESCEKANALLYK